MLNLNNLNVSFGDNHIFRSTKFEAKPGELTLIIGESGTGKTTLLNIIKGLYKSEVHYKNFLVELENYQDFIFQNVGIVEQTPTFFDNLTVKDNIHFVMDLYEIQDFPKNFLEKLKLNDLLVKFPSQLSGGEKTRLSILLATIKNPNVLLLDEPTASLDEDNKQTVMNFLEEYAGIGKIVICATHDQQLISRAGVIYEINNKKLIKKEITKNKEKSLSENAQSKSTKSFLKYIVKSTKNEKVIKKFSYIIVSVSISILVASIFFNNALKANIQQQLDQLSNTDTIVYKAPFASSVYEYAGSEYPIEEKDITKLSNIKDVSSLEWRYDNILDNTRDFYLAKGQERIHTENFNIYNYEISGMENGEVINSVNILNDEPTETKPSFNGVDHYLHTYPKGNYETKLASSLSKEEQFKYEETGVYLTSNVYSYLFRGKEFNNNLKVGFDMPVPIYDSKGVTSLSTGDDDSNAVPVNYTTCHYVHVELPILGVIKSGESLNGENTLYAIYVPQQLISNTIGMLASNYPDEREAWYISKLGETFYESLPEEVNYDASGFDDQHIVQKKWVPNAFNVFVNDINKIEKIQNEIEKNGFNIDSKFLSSGTIEDYKNLNNTTFLYIGIAIFIFAALLNLYLKYLNRDIDDNAKDFLAKNGLEKNEQIKYLLLQYTFNTLVVFVISLLSFLLLTRIIYFMNISFIKINIVIIGALLMLSLIFEFIVPFIFIKRKKDVRITTN
ncbi:hypothetical protein A4S06_10950 [Erysipelotrichaceae bacterium MTC7]|nr:hypothetical protein A4S06_10950 [Erysipelotrichaceae bacterium MTC7]